MIHDIIKLAFAWTCQRFIFNSLAASPADMFASSQMKNLIRWQLYEIICIVFVRNGHSIDHMLLLFACVDNLQVSEWIIDIVWPDTPPKKKRIVCDLENGPVPDGIILMTKRCYSIML